MCVMCGMCARTSMHTRRAGDVQLSDTRAPATLPWCPLAGLWTLTRPQDMDLHGGGQAPGGREDGAAVLGALLDSVTQPAERVGPAPRQRECLHGDARFRLASALLPDDAHACRAWGHRDHLHPHPPDSVHGATRSQDLRRGQDLEEAQGQRMACREP